MQSQQKRVKWSRGETAEALEERTDTGITQASVEQMVNCIPDIYGNISRRPGLKILPTVNNSLFRFFTFDQYLQVFPFYITENDYILVGVHYDADMELIRIKDGVIVYKTSTSVPRPITKGIIKNEGGNLTYGYKAVSYAQQNNYMLIADSYNVYKLQIFNFETNDNSFGASCIIWQYSAGWYAADGAQTRSVTSSDVTGMNFHANSIKNYIFTEPNGQTVVYSSIKTGITLAAVTETWIGATTTFYVHAKISGLKITWYIDTNPIGSTTSFTMTNGTTYNSGQTLQSFSWTAYGQTLTGTVKIRITSTQAYFYFSSQANGASYDCTSYFANTPPQIVNFIPLGSIVQFPNNGAYMRVEGFDSDGTDQIMYGALLTPVADDNATDTSVNIEYGFVSLQPTNWQNSGTYPHPTKLLFLDQRLWAGSWASSSTQNYSVTIGSQIARYTDFKNDYNQDNEAITLDILTNFKEKIIHLVDYNGLKIMTDSYEYAYDGKVVKQSGNGSLENCEPLVFESLCLYADSTGNQIKAMQYEFTNNIFNSSSINTLAPKDLIWYPICMAAFEDKIYSTGKHLFVVNDEPIKSSFIPDPNPAPAHPRVAVCNFVPNNQANIWSRWQFPESEVSPNIATAPMIHSVVNTKTGILFLISAKYYGTEHFCIMPAILDFEALADMESPVYELTPGNYYYAPWTSSLSSYVTMPNTEVAVFANGEFQFNTTTDEYGQLQTDVSTLTNVTVGLPINAKIVSHPIDVGGKTKSVMKRIGKTQMSVHDTQAGAITINGKTGYMNPRTDHICFYGVTGMKDEIKYTITNKNGAMFHLESLLMNIEYGTLDS